MKTSDMPDAGTQAQVYITIHGTKDYSSPVPLGDGSSSKQWFMPGKESTFDVTVGEIGELAKIRLELDSKNEDSAWHVDWVCCLLLVNTVNKAQEYHITILSTNYWVFFFFLKSRFHLLNEASLSHFHFFYIW